MVIFVILNILVIFVIFCIFLIFAMHLTAMHFFFLPVPGYELSSDVEELPLQPDDPAVGGSALDDLQPQNRPPILQQPPALAALPPFDFPAIVRRSGGNTTALLASIREAEAYLEMLHDIVMLSM